MSLFSDLTKDNPSSVSNIFDDEDILISDLLNNANIPIRVKSQKDDYSKSLSFSKRCRVNPFQFTDNPISMYNNILSFVNPNYNVGSVLVFKSIKDFTKEFNIKGFDAPSIYFNIITNDINLYENVGYLYSNNIHMNINDSISNVRINTKNSFEYSSNLLYFNNSKDVDYTKYDGNIVNDRISILKQPCVEVVSLNKSGSLELNNWIINGCDNTRLIIKTCNKLIFNNIHSSNIRDLFITCKLNNLNKGLAKQFFQLFDNQHKYNVWDNVGFDSVVELKCKTLKDIISYYNNNERYVVCGMELPFKIKDIKLTDILDISNMIGLENIVVRFNKVKMIITKNKELTKSNYSYQYRDALTKGLVTLPETSDGWYISFSSFTKRV